jgi:Domain of unknown function (DUF4333)
VSPAPLGSKPRFPVRLAASTALLVLALAAVGCGDTILDSAKTEDTLQANLEKALHEKITSVDCPSAQKVEPGKTFTCTVNFSNGKQETATLKIRNKDADVSLVGLKSNK